MPFNCIPGRLLVATAATIAFCGTGGLTLDVSAGPFQKSIDITELQAAWRECDASRELAEWESVESSSIDGSNPVKGPTVNFKYDGTQFVIVENFADGRRTAIGLNQDYRFMLDAAPGSPFRIKRMFSGDEISKFRETDPEAFKLWETNKASLQGHLGLLFTRSDSWPEIVSSRGFRILSSRHATRNGMDVTEIEFECIPDDEERNRKSNPVPFIRNGRAVLFDKDRYFLPLETNYEYCDKSGTKSSDSQISYEYDFGFGPVPQLRELLIRAQDKNRAIEDRYTFKTISLGKPINKKEFRLTAFGIPEPKGLDLPSKGWPWWIKVFLFGVAAIGIAALFKRSINKGKK